MQDLVIIWASSSLMYHRHRTMLCDEQVVEKIQVESGSLEDGRLVYRFTDSPMCDYMVKFIGKLRAIPSAELVNKVRKEKLYKDSPLALRKRSCLHHVLQARSTNHRCLRHSTRSFFKRFFCSVLSWLPRIWPHPSSRSAHTITTILPPSSFADLLSTINHVITSPAHNHQ